MNLKNVNPNKLGDELSLNGIKFYMTNDLKPTEFIADNTEITFVEGTDMELVQQIIDTHDPTPLPPPKTREQILEERLKITEDALLGLMDIMMGGM